MRPPSFSVTITVHERGRAVALAAIADRARHSGTMCVTRPFYLGRRNSPLGGVEVISLHSARRGSPSLCGRVAALIALGTVRGNSVAKVQSVEWC
jgi:hypothetical protein